MQTQPIAIRAAAPGDEARIQQLVRALRPHTRYLRFFNALQELSQPWLERFSRADPQGDFTLLAVARVSGRVVGMAQYSADPYPARADFAVVVADAWQGVGVGRQLIGILMGVARGAGFERLEGEVLAENRLMLALLKAMGFRLRRDPGGALVQRASISLVTQAARAEIGWQSLGATINSAAPTQFQDPPLLPCGS